MPAPLIRLRSDDQLVAMFRAGSDEAFRAIHDRYQVRLLAYARQMLGGSTADAEDALQEVFVRVHAALLASSAPISLRAWLYRIAHNRCIDQLRRPSPIPSEIPPGAQPALSRGPRHDPPAEAERSEDLRRLVSDVHALPEQQRSALLMRELQGLSYEELALALGISVAAVKSVLLRARSGVLDAAEARAAPCAEIRLELVSAHDRGVRTSGRARRHMRECRDCCAYRCELREVSRRVASLAPVGPLGHLGLIFGLGGGGAGGGIAAGGSTAVLGGAAGVTATKVGALVCCAALLGSADALRLQTLRHPTRSGLPALTRRAAAPAPAPAPSPRAGARMSGGVIAPGSAAGRAAPAARRAPAPVEAPLTGQDGYGATPASAPSAPAQVGTVAPGAAVASSPGAPTGGVPAGAAPAAGAGAAVAGPSAPAAAGPAGGPGQASPTTGGASASTTPSAPGAAPPTAAPAAAPQPQPAGAPSGHSS